MHIVQLLFLQEFIYQTYLWVAFVEGEAEDISPERPKADPFAKEETTDDTDK